MNYEQEFAIAKAYSAKVNSCQQRGISFELSIAQFRKLMLTKTCYYTGKKLTLQLGVSADKSDTHRTTIDRVDNRLGYTKENSVACSKAVNEWKNTALESFRPDTRGLSVKNLIEILMKL